MHEFKPKEGTSRIQALKRHVPHDKKSLVRFLGLLLACTCVVMWMWQDLKWALVHWQGCLAVLGLGALVVGSRLKKLDRRHQQALTAIRKAKAGLSRADLATALRESDPKHLDGVISYLLEHEQIEWASHQDGLVLRVVTSKSH